MPTAAELRLDPVWKKLPGDKRKALDAAWLDFGDRSPVPGIA